MSVTYPDHSEICQMYSRMNRMEDKQCQQRYFQMPLQNLIVSTLNSDEQEPHLQPVMRRRNADAYQLRLISISAKSNEFDHYCQRKEETIRISSSEISSLQTLRYEYRSKLYQSLNHRVVELLDRRVDVSLGYLTVETTAKKDEKRKLCCSITTHTAK